jgi:hypothetical protein
LRDFLHIRADFFAEIGDDVGVANFQGEERIGGMLDQFCAVDGGDQEVGWRAIRARNFVNRAAEPALENRAVDFAHLGCGGFVFHAYDDAVRMKEIPDGGAFAKELRIGDDAKGQATIARVGVQRAAQLQTSTSGNRALFDDEFRGARFSCDLAGNIVDGGKIGVAVFFRRRANTDENGVAKRGSLRRHLR